MATSKCQWCKMYHDLRPANCREIETKTRKLESLQPGRRISRLQRELDELKRPRIS